MVYKIPVNYVDLLLAEVFIASFGLAFAFGNGGRELLTKFIIIVLTITALYISAAFICKTILFYSEKIVFKRPLFGQKIEIEFDKIKSVKIKHVYNAGAQMFITYESSKKNPSRIQFDYRRRKDMPLVEFLEEKGIRVLKDF